MSSSTKDLYNSSATTEASLRTEFIKTALGGIQEVAKFKPVLVRITRRDIKGKPVPCECASGITREPDKAQLCRICLGEGVKWDESSQLAYRVLSNPKEVQKPGGLINIPLVVFYLRYNTPLTILDKIVELVLDLEGQIVEPIKRENVFKIQHVEPYRLDNGKVEFMKAWGFREDVKFLNEE